MPAALAAPSVGLGTATSFAVLAGSTVTNTGPSVISGDLGVSPGSAVTGFPPGLVVNGAQHAADAVALQAQTDLTTAYNDAAARAPDASVGNIGGLTLTPGVYNASTALSLTGTVTLDAQGDPNAVFIFQAGSTLITASASSVNLIGGTQACNVFWQVGSSATLGTGSTFVGSILALTSVTVTTGATVDGQVLARNGAVTLDTNTITRPTCTTTPTPTGPAVTGQPSPVTVAPGAPVTFSATASGYPTPTVQWQSSADGITWTGIAGATATTLSLPAVTAEQSGTRYRAVFTNSQGSATTNAATLTVTGTLPITSGGPVPRLVGLGAALLTVGFLTLLATRRRHGPV